MKSLYPQASEIIINSPERLGLFCETFVYEPENVSEEKIGYCYLIGEAESDNQERSEPTYLLNLLAVRLSQDIYQKTNLEPGQALEQTLKSLNKIFAKLFDEEKISWLRNLHLSVFLLTPEGKLYFSNVGRAKSFLWRKDSILDIGTDFADDNNRELYPKRLFKSIAAGKVELSDKLIFTTPNLTEKIDPKKMKLVLKKFSAERLENLRSMLVKNYKIDSLATLILEIKAEKPRFKKIAQDEKTPQNKKDIAPKESPLKKIAPLKQKAIVLIGISGAFMIAFLKKIITKERLKKIRLPFFSPKISSRRRLVIWGLIILIVTAISISILILKRPPKISTPPVDSRELIIENPETLLDLNIHTLSFYPRGFTLLKDGYLFFDKNSLYFWQNSTQKGEFLFPPFRKQSELNHQTNFKDQLVFLGGLGELIFFNQENKNFEIKNSSLSETNNILDFDVFDDNLYLLDSEPKIYKFARQNFNQALSWFSDEQSSLPVDLLSFAIDGSIYILQRDGSLLKYIQGKKAEDFLIQLPYPITGAAKLKTSPEDKNLYAFVAQEKKVYVFEKESKTLIKMISSPAFESPLDFFVNEEAKIIYLLDGKKLYRINY